MIKVYIQHIIKVDHLFQSITQHRTQKTKPNTTKIDMQQQS